MRRLRYALFVLPILFANLHVLAQQGTAELGIRLSPDGGGLSGKYFFDPHIAFEGQVNVGALYNGSTLNVVGLAEYHITFKDPSWRFFAGGGIHFGTWDRYGDGYIQGIVGIDAIAGMEYIFKQLPIAVSADLKPAVDFATDAAFFPHNIFGLSCRYYFSRDKFNKLRE